MKAGNEKKSALVTGATRGIGRAVAARLLRDGWRVLCTGTKPEEELGEVLPELRALGEVFYLWGDISRPEDREALAQACRETFDGLDLLVNNAGVAPLRRADLLEVTPESMDRVLDINLKGTFFLTSAISRLMMDYKRQNPERFPVIVNISSVSAYTSSVSRGEYCVSKAGVSMITALFADRLAEEGIGVYEIRPGIIRTDMTAPVSAKYDRLIAEGLTPIRRWGQPEDVADAVAVLASGALRFSTGEVINVDGGFHLRRL